MNVLFCDTNVLNGDQTFDRLFGNRSELEALSNNFSIVIPEVVISELLLHKSKQFESQKRSALRNGIIRYLGFDLSLIDNLSFDELKSHIIQSESIEYSTCPSGNPASFFEEFLPLALENKPPFETKSDKGFKDACIAHSINEYIRANPGEDYCAYTKDEKLIEYLSRIEALSVFSQIDELLAQPQKCIGVNDNASLQEKKPDTINDAEETRPGATQGQLEELHTLTERLSTSSSFIETHTIVGKLTNSKALLGMAEKRAILSAAVNNNQVKWLLQDDDVSNLINPIFFECQDFLDDRSYAAYVDAAGLPNDRTDNQGNCLYSRSERDKYRSFVDGLLNHISSRDWDSTVNLDSDSIISGLRRLLANATLDSSLLTWQNIAKIIIVGSCTVENAPANESTVESFCSLLESSSLHKKNDIVGMIRDRIELDIEEELPF